MTELSFETPDDAIAALKAIYLRDGADAALRAARDLLVVGSTPMNCARLSPARGAPAVSDRFVPLPSAPRVDCGGDQRDHTGQGHQLRNRGGSERHG